MLSRRVLLAAGVVPAVARPERIVVSGGVLRFGALRVRCAVGRTGVRAAKREGDGATPAGVFPLRQVFYRPDRGAAPATRLPVAPLSPDDAWSDDPADPGYNTRVTRPRATHTETLWRDDALYDVLAVIGANDHPAVPGRGSAIFLHVASPHYGGTDGCVAISRPDLNRLLAGCGPETEIAIG